MSSLKRTALLLILLLASSASAFSYPTFLEAYKDDIFTNPKNKDVICSFCHMSPSGGDERNVFGKAFEAGGEVFTPMLRAQFPERFLYPMVKVNDTLTIYFSDPDNKVIVVQSGDTRTLVDVSKQTVDGKRAVPGGIAMDMWKDLPGRTDAATPPRRRGFQKLVPYSEAGRSF